MRKKNKSKYFFQRKKLSFARRFFENGLSAASYILLKLKEEKKIFLETFLDSLPNSYPEFKFLKETIREKPKKLTKNNTRVNLYQLERQGLIEKDTKQKIYFLSDKGKEMVDYIYNRYSIFEKTWDKKIRIVIFDIPEKKKGYREWFRKELLLLQFKPLQKSVYVGKYPLPLTLYNDINEFNLEKYIYVFTVGSIDKKSQIEQLLEE